MVKNGGKMSFMTRLEEIMKMLMNYIDKETIDQYADIESDIFGDIILQAMGYNASCAMFCKCSKDDESYNISWVLANGEQYVKTFCTEEIIRAFQGKVLNLQYSVER